MVQNKSGRRIFLSAILGASSKQVQTKVIDNKLKIIDDVPSSAVEMAVKEKVFGNSNGFLLLTHFSSVPEKSSATGAYCGRGKAGVEASLQCKEDQQGSLQGDPQEDCSKGLVT